MIYDKATANLDKAQIDWCVFGDVDEKYPFFVMLEKAARVNREGRWRPRYDFHLIYGEDDDVDEKEQLVLDTLWDNADCYAIDSFMGLRKMKFEGSEREWEFTTIRVVFLDV